MTQTRACVIALAAGMAIGGSTLAQTWDGGGADNNWNTALNNRHSDYNSPCTCVAQADLSSWKSQVETLLPSGKAAIGRTANKVTITMTWDEHGTTQTFETTSIL